MTQRSSLGPRLQRHRTAVSALGVIGWLVTGPLIVLISLVVVGASRLPELLLIALVGVVITAVMAAYLLWSTSAYLDVHEGGVVVGRSISAGRPRQMRFTEIHPGTLRVHTGINSLQPTMSQRFGRFSNAHLFLASGSDLGVTFLGPDRDSELSGRDRPPASSCSPPARQRRSPISCGPGSRGPAALPTWRGSTCATACGSCPATGSVHSSRSPGWRTADHLVST